MSEQLYQRCPICNGTLQAPEDATGNWPLSADGSGERRCICTLGKTAGWVEVGLTMGQVERALRKEALYNAEHPADSDEAISEEWLRSIGFKDYLEPNEYCTSYLSFWLEPKKHNAAFLAVHWARPDNPQGSYWSANGFSLYKPAYPKTRGAVRRILLALGIAPSPESKE
jgi:hypothetical protein